jgi:two-component system sensor histidine kinase VicK
MAISNPHLYLAERATELLFIYDLNQQRFTYMNPRCIDFFDIATINVTYRSLLHMVHLEDQRYVLSKLKIFKTNQIIPDFECRVNRGNHHRWLQVKLHWANESGDRLLLGEAKDITSYKARIEVVSKHNTKKNSILNILAHDLAGPMGTIASLAALLARDTAKFQDSSVEKYIGMIDRITKNGMKLIRDFLEQEFLESASVSLKKRRIELIEKIKVATEDYFEMQNDMQIQFSCHSNKDRIYVEIDEDKFMQVINNLISNALKFTPDGGHIDIYIKENDKDIVVSIADNGIGIPEKYHATLFEKFNNARRSGLKGEQSTGLGMSIIKTIVEWHNGKIWFESEENKGTTFYIQLQKG